MIPERMKLNCAQFGQKNSTVVVAASGGGGFQKQSQVYGQRMNSLDCLEHGRSSWWMPDAIRPT